jgi:hypothetical protein
MVKSHLNKEAHHSAINYEYKKMDKKKGYSQFPQEKRCGDTECPISKKELYLDSMRGQFHI